MCKLRVNPVLHAQTVLTPQNRILCFLDGASLYNLINRTNLVHNFFLNIFIAYLYMLRATMCPSSGETAVPMRHLVLVTLYRWLSGMPCIPDSHPHLLLLLLALQPTVGFILLSDFLPFCPFFTLLSPPSYSHYLQIFFNACNPSLPWSSSSSRTYRFPL